MFGYKTTVTDVTLTQGFPKFFASDSFQFIKVFSDPSRLAVINSWK